MSAEAAWAYLQRTDPAAIAACELAIALSPAAFVEPTLLRAVRLEALPHLSVEAEADLWFSPLVRDRTTEGMSFEPEAVPLLQQRLLEWLEGGNSRMRAQRAAALILAREAPGLRLVGERVTWWALSGGAEANERIAAELAPVLEALQQQRRGTARWARRTLPGLPTGAWRSPAVWEVFDRVSSLEAASIKVGIPPAELFGTVVLNLPAVELPIRLQGRTLDVGAFSAAHALGILVPDTRPLLVAVTSRERTEPRSTA